MQQLPFDPSSMSLATAAMIAVIFLWRELKAERENSNEAIEQMVKSTAAIEAMTNALERLRTELASRNAPNALTPPSSVSAAK